MAINIDNLQYGDELIFLSEEILKYAKEKTVSVYRSVISDPATELDFTPQSKRSKGLAFEEQLTQEDIVSLNDADKLELVKNLGLSVFKTEDKCIKETKRQYKRQKSKYGSEEASIYLNERRGAYIQKWNISPEYGIISDFSKTNGHANVFFYKDTKLEDIIDSDFGTKKINYEDEDNG